MDEEAPAVAAETEKAPRKKTKKDPLKHGELVRHLQHLMQAAERIWPESGKGKVRKAWVKRVLKDMLEAHDLVALPDGIERPLEDALVDVVIETVWQLVFVP